MRRGASNARSIIVFAGSRSRIKKTGHCAGFFVCKALSSQQPLLAVVSLYLGRALLILLDR